jgi:hypothetical protein
MTYMDKCGRQDNTCTKLLDNCQGPCVDLCIWQFHESHGKEDTNGACGEDDEQRADTQRDIIVSLAKAAGISRATAATF